MRWLMETLLTGNVGHEQHKISMSENFVCYEGLSMVEVLERVHAKYLTFQHDSW